jgi:hypothetical protein
MKRSLVWAVALLWSASALHAAPGVIRSVTLRNTSINPTLGDTAAVTATLARAGRVTVQVIDRDGYPVRVLARDAAAAAGPNTYSWNGRNAASEVVPDEAYSFRIDWTDGKESATYFPADHPAHMTALDAKYYASRTATLVYTLPVASRVHLQAGLATKNPKTGEMEGPVMKTIVNREPRAAGRVAEPWNGFDESGTIRIADMPNFVLGIAIMPLPENSVLTYGSRGPSFAAAALQRKGKSLLTPHAPSSSHAHHAGLSVLDDTSPGMTIEPLNATWSESDRAWHVQGRTLRLRIALTGPSANAFAAQPGQLYRFLDGKLSARDARPAKYPVEIEVPLTRTNGVRNLSLNWRSDYGAVAANTIRVRTGTPPVKTVAEGARR